MRSSNEMLVIPPTSAESVGVTNRIPKTSALVFDRVVMFATAEQTPPPPIGFTPFLTSSDKDDATLEKVEGRQVSLYYWFDGLRISLTAEDSTIGKQERLYAGHDSDEASALGVNRLLRAAAEELRESGFNVCPIYRSTKAYSDEYRPGNYGVVTTSLENLPIVDEANLDWSQVIDFRNDEDAWRKYRRMIHWLDGEMVGQSQSFIHDELAIRIEDYEDVLRKHGMNTLLGTLNDILDPKVLTAAAAVGVAGAQVNHLLGALAGSSITLANVAVRVTRNALDFRSKAEASRGQIAYIFEIRKRFGQA